ncbi:MULTISPECIES: hypothetical protein [Kitasatospora]
MVRARLTRPVHRAHLGEETAMRRLAPLLTFSALFAWVAFIAAWIHLDR